MSDRPAVTLSKQKGPSVKKFGKKKRWRPRSDKAIKCIENLFFSFKSSFKNIAARREDDAVRGHFTSAIQFFKEKKSSFLPARLFNPFIARCQGTKS